MRLDVYSACGAGQLLVAQSENVDILVYHTVGDVHQIVT